MSTLIVTYVKKTTAQNEIGPGVLSSLLPLQQAAPILWPPDMKNWLIWKDCWCWERLKAGGEGEDRGWDGWVASPTQWTWIWVSSGSWWWTGRPEVLQSMGLPRVRHTCATDLNWVWIMQMVIMESQGSLKVEEGGRRRAQSDVIREHGSLLLGL